VKPYTHNFIVSVVDISGKNERQKKRWIQSGNIYSADLNPRGVVLLGGRGEVTPP